MSVMENERQQSVSGDSEGGTEAQIHSPTNCKSAKSEENTTAEPQTEAEPESTEPDPELEITMANLPFGTQCRTIENQPNMKLIVRSQYWGRELKGRTVRNVHTYKNMKAPLVITSQAVLYNTDNTDGFWGCCPNHGKRVLELQEYHFSDASKGSDWDLYLVGTWVSPSQKIHEFFLLPQNQTSVDVESNLRFNAWSYFGTCYADNIRSGVDEMLRSLLLKNDVYGHRHHHVHIDIMMDKAFDRETPRSRKINNEKARAERKKSSDSVPLDRQESSVTTDSTASTEQETQPPPTPSADIAKEKNKPFATKVVGVAPHIPRFVTNESRSYLMPVSHPIARPMVGYQDSRWTGEVTQWNHEQYSVPSRSGWVSGQSSQFPSGGEHQGSHWYHPASGMHVPATGGMQQPPSYWPHAQTPHFAQAPPQTYYHSPDMQMHQYHVGIPHASMAPEPQYYNMPPDNAYYHGTPERPSGTDTSMIFREVNEGSNVGSFPHHLANISTSERSNSPPSHPDEVPSPPRMSSASPEVAHLDTAQVSPIAAADAPDVAPSDPSGPATTSGTQMSGQPMTPSAEEES